MCGYKNVTSLMSGIDFFVFFSCEMMRVFLEYNFQNTLMRVEGVQVVVVVVQVFRRLNF